MALSFAKISSLSSIVNMFAGADPVKAQLIPLDEDGIEVTDEARAFQYFPSAINDSKGANYATKNIPGGSHPLYQFINGTDRTISFEAIFTSDEDPAPPDLLGVLQGGLDISLSDVTSLISSKYGDGTAGQKKHVAPVGSAIVWLRSFLYPRYSTVDNAENAATVIPPRVCRLYLPNSGIHGTTSNGQLVLDSVDCLMNQCDVVYDAFYRNGSQRLTTVTLTFNETIQTGSENWRFANGQVMIDAWKSGTSRMDAWPLKTKGKEPSVPDAKNFLSKAKSAFNTPLSPSNIANLV